MVALFLVSHTPIRYGGGITDSIGFPLFLGSGVLALLEVERSPIGSGKGQPSSTIGRRLHAGEKMQFWCSHLVFPMHVFLSWKFH
jgi:hypothetical protein